MFMTLSRGPVSIGGINKKKTVSGLGMETPWWYGLRYIKVGDMGGEGSRCQNYFFGI